MVDIRRPGSLARGAARSQKSRSRWEPRKHLGVIALFLVLILASVFTALRVRESALGIYNGFKGLLNDARNFSSSGVNNSLNSIEQDLNSIDQRARFLSLIPKLQAIPEAIGDLREVISTVANLSNTFNVLQSEGLSMAFSGRGEELINALKTTKLDLGRLAEIGQRLRERTQELGLYEEEIGSIGGTLADLNKDLGVLIDFLDTDREQRVVLLFENHSELRPSGGFAGSYGELVLSRGNIKSLEVNDIYYPDRFLSKKVIPPPQLQGITPGWGARDTNWFFDFADSSKKLLEYLEASDIYSDQDIVFDGVIALNVRVVEDILRLTGPLAIPEYDLSLDASNFLREVQEEVETKQTPGQNPKKILQSVVPLLIDSLGRLDSNGKAALLNVFASRVKNKDIKLYFRNGELENLVSNAGVGGRDYDLDQEFVGDYLAVVNANVAGGKTDVLVDQKITLESRVDPSGMVQNNLIITRTHHGGNEPESFYNKVNQDFLRVFVVPSAELKFIQGGVSKKLEPLANYAWGGYVRDNDLSELENSRTLLAIPADGYAEEYFYSGKRIFGTWFNLQPGESRSLTLRYTGGRLPLKDGQRYKFVLDKQSGSEATFDYTLTAPDEFRWAESASQTFSFRTNTLLSRVEIDLTLRKK